MMCGYDRSTGSDASECLWVTTSTFGQVEFIEGETPVKYLGASEIAQTITFKTPLLPKLADSFCKTCGHIETVRSTMCRFLWDLVRKPIMVPRKLIYLCANSIIRSQLIYRRLDGAPART